MHDLEALQQRIKAKLAASDERRRAKQASLQQEMEEAARRSQRFTEITTPLFRDVVLPRMETLASFFENATIQRDAPSNPHHCTCCFDRNAIYPATTTVALGVDSGEEMRKVILSYKLTILPVLFRFDGHDQQVFELDKADAGSVARWIDMKLLRFLDVYTELQHLDQYQRDNLVVDPVCGMHFSKTLAAAHTEHEGRSYYFCTEKCLQYFEENPSTFRRKAEH